MKNFKRMIALSLCLTMILLAAVACVDNTENIFDDYEAPTLSGSDDSDTGFVTAPPVEDTEDDAYINAAPANDEQGWGPLTPRP